MLTHRKHLENSARQRVGLRLEEFLRLWRRGGNVREGLAPSQASEEGRCFRIGA